MSTCCPQSPGMGLNFSEDLSGEYIKYADICDVKVPTVIEKPMNVE